MNKPAASLLSPALRRIFFAWSRIIHIYISTALFTLLVFFCISGFTLNHAAWFNDTSSNQHYIALPAALVEELLTTDSDGEVWPQSMVGLNDFVKQELGLKNPRSVTTDREVVEIELDYPLPAGYAYVVVDVRAGELSVEQETGNVWALMNDLHKGRHTGVVWSWVIDLSAGLMLLFALTGLFILFQLRRRRKTGLMAVVIGTLTPLVLYLLFVPSL